MYTTRKNFNITPRTIGGLIEDVFQNGVNRYNEEVSAYLAPVNIHENDKGYDIHLIAPGLKKEDFKLNADNNVLHISYEHKESTTEQGTSKLLRSEYKTRSFKRSFTLNEKIDAANITAKYTDGILVVNLPKKEINEQTAKDIAVG
jgi:HSP20 family protein